VFSVLLSVITVPVSRAFVTHLPRMIPHQARFSRQRTYQIIGIVFLVVLVSCNTAQGASLPHKSMPRRYVPLSSTIPALSSTDWPTYHHDNARTGYLANEPDPKQLISAWTTKLGNAVYAEPLVIGDRVIVATEGDSLYSLDARTGQVQWHTNIGNPVPVSMLPCGNIDPLGITGTPVYDPATGLVFAVGEVTGPVHLLVGVDLNTGKLRVQRSVNAPGMPPQIYQQRAALALYQNMVYIAYGGLSGECENYHGAVVASRTDGTGPLLSYQVPTEIEGGIWGPSGPAIDDAGQVYVATGDDAHISGGWDLSDAVLRLSPTLQLEDSFAPANWRLQDTGNQDLGSMGPSLLPGGLVFIAGKSGDGYLLHANALGGIGGQAATVKICDGLATGGAATVGSQVFVPCSDGLRRVLDPAGTKLAVDWHAAEQINLPPIVGGHTLYSLDPSGILYALDIDSGLVRAKLSLGFAVPHFATPSLSQGRIFVGTLEGVSTVTIA